MAQSIALTREWRSVRRRRPGVCWHGLIPRYRVSGHNHDQRDESMDESQFVPFLRTSRALPRRAPPAPLGRPERGSWRSNLALTCASISRTNPWFPTRRRQWHSAGEYLLLTLREVRSDGRSAVLCRLGDVGF